MLAVNFPIAARNIACYCKPLSLAIPVDRLLSQIMCIGMCEKRGLSAFPLNDLESLLVFLFMNNRPLSRFKHWTQSQLAEAGYR